MKISRIKHVVITSIIFLFIIAIIVAVYSSTISMMEKNTVKKVYRIVATEDIDQGQTISNNNVKLIEMPDSLELENAVYRKNKADNMRNSVEDTEEVLKTLADVQAGKISKDDVQIKLTAPDDDLWAIGKIAKEKIYKGEILIADKIVHSENMIAEETRLYAIPFDSTTTGGYNISLGEKVDVCVLYNDNQKTIAEYQNLDRNKVIDVVLAGKVIADIRDESGNTRKDKAGAAVVPGYVCFNLTYEEINKVELAKRQGTLFIGSPENYYKDGSQAETFMPNAPMPNF